jgi:hypothetical protein
VWRQPDATGTAVAPRAAIVAATRSPAGAWAAPVALGVGELTTLGVTAASPRSGEVVSVWGEARARRPDSVPSVTCAVAATLTGSIAVTRRDLECRSQAFPGTPKVVSTSAGGAQDAVAWFALPEPGTPVPEFASITTYARGAAAGDWSPPLFAVGDVRTLSGLTPTTAGRSLLVAEVRRTAATRGVRVLLMGADGGVQRRLAGPAKPTGPSRESSPLFALGRGPTAVLSLRSVPGAVSRNRPSILSVGTG